MNEILVPGYDVVELLGFGATGEVWLAREAATGAPVALKRLRDAGDLEARERLHREAAVLAGVRHPHVVRLRGVVADGPSVALVLDVATGGSLARLLTTRRTLTPGEVVTVGVPLAQALATIHGQGLVHGDVSPANVLFSGDGRPQLSDLGLSRLLGTAASEAGGTHGFLDPAVQAGGVATPASDVLSLAATCWFALTGKAPFDDAGKRCPTAPGPVGSSQEAAAFRVLTVLEQALCPAAGDRPTAEQLAVTLFRAVPSVPVQLAARGGHAPLMPIRWRAGDDSPAPLASPTHVVARPSGSAAGSLSSGAVAGRRRLPRGRTRSGPGQVLPWWRQLVRLGSRPGLTRTRRRLSRLRLLRTHVRVVVAGMLGAAAVVGAAVTGVAWAGSDDDASQRAVIADSRLSQSVAPSSPAAASATDRPSQPAGASPPAAPPPAVPSPAADWRQVLGRLDAVRGGAFGSADISRLRAVYVSDSPALARDRRSLLSLRRSGLRAVGVRLRTTSVAVAARSSREVRLKVSDAMPAYRLVTTTGGVHEQRPGRGLRQWTVVLRLRSDGNWGVYDVLRG